MTASSHATIKSITKSIKGNLSPTATRTKTPTTTSSQASQTSTSSSTSVPVAAIVGAVIAGIVVITAIVAFTWYKISTRRQMNVLHDEPFNYESGIPLTQGYRQDKKVAVRAEAYEMEKPRTETRKAVALRYSGEGVSANVAGNY